MCDDINALTQGVECHSTLAQTAIGTCSVIPLQGYARTIIAHIPAAADRTHERITWPSIDEMMTISEVSEQPSPSFQSCRQILDSMQPTEPNDSFSSTSQAVQGSSPVRCQLSSFMAGIKWMHMAARLHHIDLSQVATISLKPDIHIDFQEHHPTTRYFAIKRFSSYSAVSDNWEARKFPSPPRISWSQLLMDDSVPSKKWFQLLMDEPDLLSPVFYLYFFIPAFISLPVCTWRAQIQDPFDPG